MCHYYRRIHLHEKLVGYFILLRNNYGRRVNRITVKFDNVGNLSAIMTKSYTEASNTDFHCIDFGMRFGEF